VAGVKAARSAPAGLGLDALPNPRRWPMRCKARPRLAPHRDRRAGDERRRGHAAREFFSAPAAPVRAAPAAGMAWDAGPGHRAAGERRHALRAGGGSPLGADGPPARGRGASAPGLVGGRGQPLKTAPQRGAWLNLAATGRAGPWTDEEGRRPDDS